LVKVFPSDHWERTCEKGFQLVYGATANLFLDRHNNYIGYGPEAKELVGILILKLFVSYLGIKKLQEYLLLVLETEKKEKTQVDI
jgi:hypothetical protein